MKRYTKIIQGIEVQVISIGGHIGWFCNFKGNVYGDYVVLNKDQLKSKYKEFVEETFELLELQAELTVKKLKEL